jgi:hypothetical protein
MYYNQDTIIIILMVIIVILLLFVVMHNANNNQFIENMTSSENIEAIQNISSMMENGTLKISNLEVSENITIGKDLDVGGYVTNDLHLKGNLTTNDDKIRFTVAGDDAYIQTKQPNIIISNYNSSGVGSQTLSVNKISAKSTITSGGEEVAKYGDKLGIDTFENRNRLFVTTQKGDGDNFVSYFTNTNESKSDKCSDNSGRNCLRLTKLF